MTDVLPAGSLDGKVALVTGSSRGIGADTVRYLAEAGADVVINFRNKAPRAEKLAAQLRELGGRALVVGADLTDPASVAGMFEAIRAEYGLLDILVLNASGGMESGMAEDYALALNRDAQLTVLNAATPLLGDGSRVVFVTSHQAHFIRTTPTMPEYEPVALSKRAGEDALRELIPGLAEKGIGFTVVSGDMIEGTITATLLERANPGAIAERRESAGKLYNVSEFAAEVAQAAIDPVPADNTRLVGDVSAFAAEYPRPRPTIGPDLLRADRGRTCSRGPSGRRALLSGGEGLRILAERDRANDLHDAQCHERDAQQQPERQTGDDRREEHDDSGDDAQQRVEQRPDARSVAAEQRQRHDAVDDPADADEDDDDEGQGRRCGAEVQIGDHTGGDVDQAEHDVTDARPSALRVVEDGEADVDEAADDQVGGEDRGHDHRGLHGPDQQHEAGDQSDRAGDGQRDTDGLEEGLRYGEWFGHDVDPF